MSDRPARRGTPGGRSTRSRASRHRFAWGLTTPACDSLAQASQTLLGSPASAGRSRTKEDTRCEVPNSTARRHDDARGGCAAPSRTTCSRSTATAARCTAVTSAAARSSRSSGTSTASAVEVTGRIESTRLVSSMSRRFKQLRVARQLQLARSRYPSRRVEWFHVSQHARADQVVALQESLGGGAGVGSPGRVRRRS